MFVYSFEYLLISSEWSRYLLVPGTLKISKFWCISVLFVYECAPGMKLTCFTSHPWSYVLSSDPRLWISTWGKWGEMQWSYGSPLGGSEARYFSMDETSTSMMFHKITSCTGNERGDIEIKDRRLTSWTRQLSSSSSTDFGFHDDEWSTVTGNHTPVPHWEDHTHTTSRWCSKEHGQVQNNPIGSFVWWLYSPDFLVHLLFIMKPS
jgi:hypothetical protein